jgi:hypothetical protein
MRFCPFCSAENPSDASHCATCARRLPPLPPRKQKGVGEATGIVATQAPAPAAAPPATTSAPLPTLSPAAVRRQSEPVEPRADGAPTRRRTDSVPPPVPAPRQATITPLPPPPTVTKPPTMPPPQPLPPILPPDAPKAGGTPTPAAVRDHTSVDPPPTRIARAHELEDRPFVPPKVIPIPEIPEPGLMNSVRYATTFMRARWQRRGAIKHLGEEIKQDTASLDVVLGTLGAEARALKIDNRVLAGENQAITAAEERKKRLDEQNAELGGRKNEEVVKFGEVERDRLNKVSDAERMLEDANQELASYEGQRRSLRDKRKEVERRQKAYLKAAEDRESEAGNAPMGDTRSELRRAAEQHRKEVAALEPERQDLDRRLAALDRPLAQSQAKVDAARAELESARRSLHDAREGNRHRLAEIEAEQGRKTRELAQADSEIQRRLVTLGTLINLNRIDHAGFVELYERIDRLRMAIGARTTEIDKLTAEREAYDRGSLVRGFVTLGAGVVLLITLFVILLAVL